MARQWLRKSNFWRIRTRPGFPSVLTNRRFPFGPLELSKAIKISVIDDDDLVREAIESLIQSLGYEVDTFASAAEAGQRAEEAVEALERAAMGCGDAITACKEAMQG